MRFFFPLVLLINLIPVLSADNIDLISEINEYRAENGLQGLVYEEKLAITASLYAQELLNNRWISHVDKKGRRVLDRYRAAGGTASEAGEILGTSTDPTLIFSAWKDSPVHNQLILDPKWNRIGVSTVEENGQLVSVVLFSLSMIEGFRLESSGEDLILEIEVIENRKVFFNGKLELVKVIGSEETGNIYRFQLQAENLPLLLPVYGDFEGIKKITDFLYIPDEILNETH